MLIGPILKSIANNKENIFLTILLLILKLELLDELSVCLYLILVLLICLMHDRLQFRVEDLIVGEDILESLVDIESISYGFSQFIPRQFLAVILNSSLLLVVVFVVNSVNLLHQLSLLPFLVVENGNLSAVSAGYNNLFFVLEAPVNIQLLELEHNFVDELALSLVLFLL